ncbi:developmental protein, partial [Francisella tularensis subsp. holarctica]|nr:developmental protein [Francisella tularensis subsp. holarctica]
MKYFKEIEIILDIIKTTIEIIEDNDNDNEKISYHRNNIIKSIFFLQEELLEKYRETVCKYIVFPLLAYVDEKLI